MKEYEIHEENINTLHTILKTMESEAEIIKVLITITKTLQAKLEKKGIYCFDNYAYSWASENRQTLLDNIKEIKSIIGASFISDLKSASSEELNALITAERNNIDILINQITEMNEVSLFLVEKNLILKKARRLLED